MSDLIDSVAKALSALDATSNNFTAAPVVAQPKVETPEVPETKDEE